MSDSNVVPIAPALPDAALMLDRHLAARIDFDYRVDHWAARVQSNRTVVDFMLSGLPASLLDDDLGEIMFYSRLHAEPDELVNRVALFALDKSWAVMDVYANRQRIEGNAVADQSGMGAAAWIGSAHVFGAEATARSYGLACASRKLRTGACTVQRTHAAACC